MEARTAAGAQIGARPGAVGRPLILRWRGGCPGLKPDPLGRGQPSPLKGGGFASQQERLWRRGRLRQVDRWLNGSPQEQVAGT